MKQRFVTSFILLCIYLIVVIQLQNGFLTLVGILSLVVSVWMYLNASRKEKEREQKALESRPRDPERIYYPTKKQEEQPIQAKSGAWECPNCQRVTPQAVTCPGCGTRMGVFCPSCAELTEITQKFCHHCGRNKEAEYQARKQREIEQLERRKGEIQEDLKQANENVRFPNLVFKSLFRSGFGCMRVIAGFAMLIGGGTYLFTQLAGPDFFHPGAYAEGLSQGSLVFLAGLVVYCAVSISGFLDQQNNRIRFDLAGIENLNAEIQATRSLTFLQWCDRLHTEKDRVRRESESREDRSSGGGYQISDDEYRMWQKQEDEDRASRSTMDNFLHDLFH
jgi:hypothetical protein